MGMPGPVSPRVPPGGRQTQPAAPETVESLFYLHRPQATASTRTGAGRSLSSFTYTRVSSPPGSQGLTLTSRGSTGRPCPAVRPGDRSPRLSSLGTAVSAHRACLCWALRAPGHAFAPQRVSDPLGR